jgi:serine phosphatase RsbU (regulator of sigma subunit)
MPADRYLRTQRAMFAAPAHALVDHLAAALREHYDAIRVEVLLADFQLAVLCPVLGDGATLPVTGSQPGQAFVDQRTIVTDLPSGVRVTLPVAMRGDALGVLVLDRAEAPDAATAAELLALATALAHDLRAADTVTDRYQLARRQARLTVAAEMQWRLLPGRACTGPEFSLAGQLEPAYAVRGDNFDWVADRDRLLVTVTNGHGDGVEASMLTLLAVTALRNARMVTDRLADQAALADQAVFAAHGGRRHLSTLLMRFDLATATVTAVDAGSPMLLRLRGDDLRPVPLDAQLPLGMFDATDYTEQTFSVRPGDRLFVLSDGVHDGRYGDQRYSEHGRLRQTVLGTRRLPPGEAVRAVLADHGVFRQGAPLDDDAAVVCLDWTGRPGEPVVPAE